MDVALKVLRRLSLALLACLALATLWIAWSTNRYLQNDIDLSAERVARVILHRERVGAGDPYPLPIASILQSIAPGVCVKISVPSTPDHPNICGSWGNNDPAGPQWFGMIMKNWINIEKTSSRVIMISVHRHGLVITSADRVIIIRRAWERFTTVACTAFAVTIFTTVISAFVIGHTLLPANALIRGMKNLSQGDLKARVADSTQPEFQPLIKAFNQLADNLELAHRERISLSRKLFHVQEEERLEIARELHDEFGQCLTSAGALAACIENGAPKERRDIAADARFIGETVARMKATLRGALHKLRPPEIEELGLAESLEALVASWDQQGSATRYRFTIANSLPPVDRTCALVIYRIVQEGLTNAVRHGSPGTVWIELSRGGGDGDALVVSIRDDGSGSRQPSSLTSGLGLLGMRERVLAVGGNLLAAPTSDGFVVEASFPIGAIAGAI